MLDILGAGSFFLARGLAFRIQHLPQSPASPAPISRPPTTMMAEPEMRELIQPPSSRVLPGYIAAILGAALVIVVYVWFVSVGYWTWWPKTTYTFDLLATAFAHGHLFLEEVPAPALLALSDPYAPAARTGIQFPWDASLYGGHYYLYWGPVPALILAAIRFFYQNQIADQYLVFAFLLGTFMLAALFLMQLWWRYFQDRVPVAVVLIGVIVIGLIGPTTWLLSRPAGYEAAIAGGQFFLMAGFYAASTSLLAEPITKWKLVFAGVSWSLAIGSRVSTLFPVLCLTVIIVYELAKRRGAPGTLRGSVMRLILPLVAGAIGLAWYNWARFGSVIEFGLRYQLTELNLHAAYDRAFSGSYVVDNLRNYLLNPVRIAPPFPFVTPLPPQALPAGPARDLAPDALESVTGLLVSSPFLVYAVIPFVALLATGNRTRAVDQPRLTPAIRLPLWIHAGLLASSIVSLALLVLYFYPTMRQLEDVVPLLAVLSVLGFWQSWSYLREHSVLQALSTILALSLALLSILMSCLLAITSYDNRFLHLNRELLRQLIHFFGR